MKYKIFFTLFNVKNNLIQSGRYPDWISDSKPQFNCGMLTFKRPLFPGQSHICYLEPLVPELWKNIELNETLKCMEGNSLVGTATICKIVENNILYKFIDKLKQFCKNT